MIRFLVALALGLFALAPPASASQGSACLPTTGPLPPLTFINAVQTAIDTLISTNSGVTSPGTNCSGVAVKGQLWLDTSTAPHVLKMWDGAAWLATGTMDAAAHLWGLPAPSGPIRAVDGNAAAPGLNFAGEASTGLRRAGSADLRVTLAGSDALQVLPSSVAIGGEPGLGLRRAGTGDLRLTVGGTDILQIGTGGLTLLQGVTNFEPPGVVKDFAGATPPPGYLLAAGQCVSRTTYAALFAVVGVTHGACDGSTTFGIPDLRGRVVAGRDDMGGTAASRLTTLVGGINGTALGAVGGFQSKTLAVSEIPVHTHAVGVTVTYPDAFSASVSSTSGNIGLGSVAFLNGFGTSITPVADRSFSSTSGTTGGGSAFSIVQPTAILNKIIKH